MMNEPFADARAWTSGTIDPPDSWRYTLSPDAVAELDELATSESRDGADITGLRVGGRLPACDQALAPVRAALDHGRGFVVIDRLPGSRTAPQRIAAYWVLGQVLGAPLEQDVEGALLFDVRDTGRSVSEGVRFSVTNAESTFHTDAAFNAEPPDYVGLLGRIPRRVRARARPDAGHQQPLDPP